MGCRRGSGAARIAIPIINPSVVDQLMVAIEDRRFGRNLHVAQSDQLVFRIAQPGQLITVVLKIFMDTAGRFGLVRKHQPETGSISVTFADLLDGGSVTAGDRAISPQKDEDYHFCVIRSKWVERATIKIEGVLPVRDAGDG